MRQLVGAVPRAYAHVCLCSSGRRREVAGQVGSAGEKAEGREVVRGPLRRWLRAQGRQGRGMVAGPSFLHAMVVGGGSYAAVPRPPSQLENVPQQELPVQTTNSQCQAY